MSMRERLIELTDKPVTIKLGSGASGTIGSFQQVGFSVKAETVQGTVLDVQEELVDLLVDHGIMRSIRIAAIAEVALSTFMARQMVLEDPPAHEGWAKAKRLLFQAEEMINLRQPADVVAGRAAQAADLLREIRAAFPKHRGVAKRLERAHFLATGRYDYERDESVTGGDVEDGSYGAAKEYVEKLEQALKARRPEGEVAALLPHLARYSGRALARYPNHAELKAWFARAEAVRKKLSPGVQRTLTYPVNDKVFSLDEPFVAGGM